MSRTIGKDKFIETLNRVSIKAGALGEQIIKRDKDAYIRDKSSYSNSIKKEAKVYAQSVKAIKEVSGIRKLITKVDGYRTMLKSLSENISEVESNEKDLVEAKKSIGDEFINVGKLLKAGFIESIEYKENVGLLWTYPPMTYTDEGKIIFLGRPQAGLSEVHGDGFSLKLPSYAPGNNVGTAHMRHSDQGSDYCLGGYGDIVKILAAKRQVSSLIRMFREYFQSFNGKSRHNTPNYSQMDICLPKVTDDSYEVWKKKNPKFKFPDPIAIPEAEPERCGECEALVDDCECNA